MRATADLHFVKTLAAPLGLSRALGKRILSNHSSNESCDSGNDFEEILALEAVPFCFHSLSLNPEGYSVGEEGKYSRVHLDSRCLSHRSEAQKSTPQEEVMVALEKEETHSHTLHPEVRSLESQRPPAVCLLRSALPARHRQSPVILADEPAELGTCPR